ncbi:hypothetical protein MRS44_016013 [Fusarium solani]|uniref:uncharacterized protein n=1 Tax=Fusarium solani TaxID=169388 RepID=UPI0032C4A012|nr:hypothetical protein MRS44_016013 [Fusarium solani]
MVLSIALKTSVTLIGAGTQGRRLAFMWSSRGNDVHIVDGQESQLQASLKAIEGFRLEDSTKDARWGRIITHTPETLREALQASWLVVECVPEQLPLKRKVISQLDSLAPEETIIASNSSSYACSEILEGLTLRNEHRFLSAHSYWPPETAEIEIMGHETTNPSYIPLMMEQCKAHGFSPFHVKSQSMGYIYNRIWAAIKREALLAASEGTATPAEIDAMFKGVLKTPKGPFEQMDIVGLDVVHDIEQHYADARGEIPSGPENFLLRLLRSPFPILSLTLLLLLVGFEHVYEPAEHHLHWEHPPRQLVVPVHLPLVLIIQASGLSPRRRLLVEQVVKPPVVFEEGVIDPEVVVPGGNGLAALRTTQFNSI